MEWTRRAPWWAFLLLGLLGTITLHGCHGDDEDHELFREQPRERIWID